MDRLLLLYPRPWQARYGAEVTALLAESPPDLRDRLDLVKGALDAHLHPMAAPTWPVAAAGIAGVAWTVAGSVALGQPVPPDWPGYLEETLPMLAGVIPLVALAGIGVSTRLGDRNPRLARIGRALVTLAAGAWTVLLLATMLRLTGGAELAAAGTAMAAGLLAVGIALLGAGDWRPAVALLAAGMCLLAPTAWSHAAFGVSLVVLATTMLADPRPTRRPPLVLG